MQHHLKEHTKSKQISDKVTGAVVIYHWPNFKSLYFKFTY